MRNIGEVKDRFPKISKDVLQETFIQVVTQLGEAFTRLDKLEQSVQGLIYTNADERLMKLESEKVARVDDSEEFTKEELKYLKEMFRDVCPIAKNRLHSTIRIKVNKMLKEKNEEERTTSY